MNLNVGRDEAMDLLGKWLTESTPLYCSAKFPLFRVVLRGKVFRLSADEVGLVSEDTLSELVLRLDTALTFGFLDLRDTGDADGFGGCLTVFFREAGEDSDFISFTEVVPPQV